jgi:hypothetical protein
LNFRYFGNWRNTEIAFVIVISLAGEGMPDFWGCIGMEWIKVGVLLLAIFDLRVIEILPPTLQRDLEWHIR